MIPERILPQIAMVTRRTAQIAEVLASAPFAAPDWTDANGFFVNLAFSPGSGGVAVGVSISGTANAAPTSITMGIDTVHPAQRSSIMFTAVSQVSYLYGSAAVVLGATRGSGQPAFKEKLIASSVRCRVTVRRTGTYFAQDQPGTQVTSAAMLYTNFDDLKSGDYVTVDGVVWEIEAPTPVYNTKGSHHIEALLRRVQ